MKKYMVYMDDGRDCFKAAIPAANEKAARKYVEGNGEVIAIKDVTKDFPISLDKVAQALKNAQFGQKNIIQLHTAVLVGFGIRNTEKR